MKNKLAIIITTLTFLFFSFWWIYLNFLGSNTEQGKINFSGVYGIMALWGGLVGMYISTKWGGLRSIIGKAIFMFGLGLFLQELGQLAYAYYINILNIEEPPYPSIGDAFFLASIPAYTYGIWLLGKATGVKSSLHHNYNKIIAVVIPVFILIISYILFLPEYEFDWSNRLLIFFDIGYPIGQAIYISLAILAYLLSRRYLGGYLKLPVLLIFLGLLFQYIADYMFSFQYNNETWAPGELNEYIFFLAYTIMTYGLFIFGSSLEKLKKDG